MTRTISPATGVIDMTRGDADSVKYTIIARDTNSYSDYVIGYDYQLEEILEPMVYLSDKRDNKEFREELTRAWHWRDKDELERLMWLLDVSIEYFEEFLKRNSGKWTYPEGLNHEFTEELAHALHKE